MSEIEKILEKLDPKTRQRVSQASGITLKRLPTPSVGLNTALKGGFGYGRQSLVWGNKSAGKSSFCLQMVAEAQNDGEQCAWIDAEHSFDPSWAAKLGVDSSELIISPVKTINDMADVVTDLMFAGVQVIVVDSISSLLSSAYFEKDSTELKALEKTKQIGTEAKDLAHAVKAMNYANDNTALILISQVRNQINTYGASKKPTGGHAVEFFSSTSVKLWSSPKESEQITGEVYVGDKIFKQPVGRPVNWTVEYNKIGPPNQVGAYDFYYDGEFIGVDNIGEVVDVAERFGLIIKSSTWYKIGDENFQGKKKVVNWLRENPDELEKLAGRINEQV